MKNNTNNYGVLKGSIEEIVVPKDNPFMYDELDRKPYAETLSNVVRSFQKGTVIGLNGSWGTGKTTFVRMWKQHLENEHFPVAYYNAWVDDISDEPLFSLLKQLKEAANQGKDGSKLKKVLKTGARILARIAFAGAKASMGKVSEFIINAGEGSAEEIKKILEEAGEGGLDAIQGVFEKSLEDEKDSMHSLMKDFKEAFQSYVEYDKDEERAAVPFVYFVDELDRCNPTFAVKVLERIKHLFEVPNVVFVLSVDKKQLAYSINGYFGSDKFDSNEYLRRFIGIEYNLPRLVGPVYCSHLDEKYSIIQVIRSIKQNCENYASLYATYNRLMKEISIADEISLRQLERIYTIVQLMLFNKSFVDSFIKTDEEIYFIPICYFLAYLKVCKNDIYQNILSRSYSVLELFEKLDELMPQDSRVDLYYKQQYVNDFEHKGLCALLILAHYCEASVLERKRNAQKNGASKQTKVTSFQEFKRNNFKYKNISANLLTANESLFDQELKSIKVWLDLMEMYQFEA